MERGGEWGGDLSGEFAVGLRGEQGGDFRGGRCFIGEGDWLRKVLIHS